MYFLNLKSDLKAGFLVGMTIRFSDSSPTPTFDWMNNKF